MIFKIYVLYMLIEKIVSLSSRYSRFRIHLNTYEYYDIGSKRVKTYIDGASEEEKKEYWNKQLNNYTTNLFLSSFIPSHVLFTCYLLWGKHRSIHENKQWLNGLLSQITWFPENYSFTSRYLNTCAVYKFYNNNG